MNEITIDTLLKEIREYDSSDLTCVRKAYDFANDLHSGQYRESGEEYIVHPLNVAYILAQMHVDLDTICAGLLHDTVEDTPCTLDDIEECFNKEVRILVDGVTKISNIPFATIKEVNLANTRKIIDSAMIDIRIIIIKLADRLHNMRTLEYKAKDKQIKKAYETMEIFVPLAYSLGAYRIKNELEDLSFKYLMNDEYKRTLEEYQRIDKESKDCLTEMLINIKEALNSDNVDNNIKMRIKHLYGIYIRKCQGHKISDIHDLLNLKVMVPDINECYLTLGRVHKLYHPVNDKFKDYIYNPKTNLYQSLHTTVFAPDERLVQAQIRTFDMDKIASFGLPTYWYLKSKDSKLTMQEEFKNKFQIYDNLKEISNFFYDNEEFVDNVKKELLSENVYVYTPEGDIYELPKDSTPVDFAYRLGNDFGNQIIKAFVNDAEVPLDYKLKNNDRIKIITDVKSFPKEEWESSVSTSLAKRRIKDFNIAFNSLKK